MVLGMNEVMNTSETVKLCDALEYMQKYFWCVLNPSGGGKLDAYNKRDRTQLLHHFEDMDEVYDFIKKHEKEMNA